MTAPIPVTVVAGYLGSGKTTLLNQVLRQADGRRIAVLVNDFGEVGIDDELIAAADGDTITLTNGCVCCRIGSDLMTALWSVRDREVPPDRVVIEASGIADPAPIAHHALTPGFDLDGVVVLLDAETVRRRERHPIVGRTIRRQLAGADVLVLNKIDLVSAAHSAISTRGWRMSPPGFRCCTPAPARSRRRRCSGWIPLRYNASRRPTTGMSTSPPAPSSTGPWPGTDLNVCSTTCRTGCCASKEFCALRSRPTGAPWPTGWPPGAASLPTPTGATVNRVGSS